MIPVHDADAFRGVIGGCVPPSAAAARAAARILLVDDEARLLDSLRLILEGVGYQIALADSGAAAREALQREPFDVVLLDLNLPDCLGSEVIAHARALALDVRFIVLSGNTGVDLAVRALKEGADDYIQKPYKPDAILTALRHAVVERDLVRENRRIASQLESSQKLYRYLVDSSPDLIYILNSAGYFSFVNDRANQLLGIPPEALIGKHYSSIVVPDDLERARYVFNERRVGARASRNVELRLRVHDQAARAFETTVTTVSFNATAIYAAGPGDAPEYLGTYGVARDISEKKRAEEQITYQAYHDILTSLPNRALFRDRLGLALIQAKRNERELAVMFVDLDRFKVVNDSFGHIQGDVVLQQAALRLKECLRKGDTLARIGGDEFTLVLPELGEAADAAVVAEKMVRVLTEPFQVNAQNVYISASVGIAVYPQDGQTIDELVRHADIAMYHVKSQGKNGVCFYAPTMVDAAHQKIVLEQSLRNALERGELEMYYQPQLDTRSGRIVGAEALMRWNHPERGLLSAGEFLPLAEEIGLIVPISHWMLGALLRDVLEWNTLGGEGVRLSLNVSPQCLDRGGLCSRIGREIAEHGIPPQQIEVEITENICIRNPQHALEQLHQLHAIGVTTAIDDFGTGYSSLSYLHRFPINTIKIDQSFVRQIQEADGHYPVVLAIISMAAGLGLHLVAEGVETAAQASYLKKSGCATMQGYYYFRPMPQEKFLDLLRIHNAEPQPIA